jgi:ribonuclease Z
MARLVILGTAWVIPDKAHENTHLVASGDHGAVLIDSGTNPIVSLERAGIDPARLEALIVTHFHPDHVSGVPMLLINLWLVGRQQPFSIHGLRVALDKIQGMMGLFEWAEWPQFYPVTFDKVSAVEGALVLETLDFRIVAAPMHHLVPSIAIRVTSKASGRSFAYSSDTSPCDALVGLARDADFMLHEASGASAGHSSAAMAGSLARQAGVRHLVLVHYDGKSNPADLVAEAHSTFDGQVSVPQDLDEFEF